MTTIEKVAAARAMLDEARRLRDFQENVVDDLRNRSGTILSVMAAALTLAIGLLPDVSAVAGWVSLLLLVIMLAAALTVHRPWEYTPGPKIELINEKMYEAGLSEAQVLRGLAFSHQKHYRDNRDGPVQAMQKAFMCELVAGVCIAAVILADQVV